MCDVTLFESKNLRLWYQCEGLDINFCNVLRVISFIAGFQVAALQSDLTNVQKGRTDEEAAKRTAEEAIERERNENKEKVGVFKTTVTFNHTVRGCHR